MIDFREHARQLLEEYNLCVQAKPRHNAVDVQLEKDAVSKWAVHLNNQLGWGSENDIAEACYQLEPRLQSLKKNLVMEILQNGTI
jgi:hypothetical protein